MHTDHSRARNYASVSQQRYLHAKTLIPGGTQLLSKRPEMHAPQRWPPYYQSAKGCEIVDSDGQTYVDMSLMGVGACLLGYADPDVSEAVIRRVRDGSMCTLNVPEEVTLAEALIEIHAWAEQARFVRTGGEAMAVAVRIARAATNRDVVAFCGYHGWHDWYLAANRRGKSTHDALSGHLLSGLSPAGVPTQLGGTAHPFPYNDIERLAEIVKNHGDQLAAVVMEPSRSIAPHPGFLEGVRSLCDRCGAKLVFDEISSGWRFAFGGIHLEYGVVPDLAVFGKALGNGHPIAAVIGNATTMSAAQDSFISSTYWTEAVGPCAALATIDKMRLNDVAKHVRQIGTDFRDGLMSLSKLHDVQIGVNGHPGLLTITFNCTDTSAVMTLFTVRMLEHGILCGSSFYPSLAHNATHVTKYLNSADQVLVEIADAVKQGDAMTRIKGLVKSSGFQRLT